MEEELYKTREISRLMMMGKIVARIAGKSSGNTLLWGKKRAALSQEKRAALKREGAGLFQIENGLKGANLPRTIRFTEVLFERLGQTAQQHGISFNLLVLQCCQYALNQMGQKEIRGFPKPNFYDIMAK